MVKCQPIYQSIYLGIERDANFNYKGCATYRVGYRTVAIRQGRRIMQVSTKILHPETILGKFSIQDMPYEWVYNELFTSVQSGITYESLGQVSIDDCPDITYSNAQLRTINAHISCKHHPFAWFSHINWNPPPDEEDDPDDPPQN